MPENEEMPLWMKMFQQQVMGALKDLRDEIKLNVTRDTFNDEKSRINDELRRKGEEIKDLETALQKESTARQAAETAAAAKALAEAQARQRIGSATNWQWILIVGSVALNYLIRFLPVPGGGTP